MLSYCLKCRKIQKVKITVVRTKSGGIIFSLYQSVECVIVKKLIFLKKQETRGLLSNLGIITPFS